MKWAEVSVTVARANAEHASDMLLDSGAAGVVVIDPDFAFQVAARSPFDTFDLPESHEETDTVIVRAYFPDDSDLHTKLEQIGRKSEDLGATVGSVLVDEDDWLQVIRAQFLPERITDRIISVPAWQEYVPKDEEIMVRIDPGQAFGTGQHGSTRGAVYALEAWIKQGCSVLDIGTGSGILGIIAARLGAARVLGVDLDPVAVEAARRNVRANGVGEVMTVACGDLLEGIVEEFHVVCANILAEAVKAIIPGLPRVLAPAGVFICSGFTHTAEPQVLDALSANAHKVVGRYDVDGWVTLVSEGPLCAGSS